MEQITLTYNNLTSTYNYIDGKYILDSQKAIYDHDNDYLSKITHTIDLSTINFDLEFINEIKKSSLLSNGLTYNSLVLSMFDKQMYYDRNPYKSSYHYNNMLFIDNDKNIIPLALNIHNIDSPLTIINNEIQTRIDSNTIIDEDKQLTADYTKLSLANGNIKGLFKVDNESLMMENNKVTLSYTIADIIDNIDDHISIMNNVITQSSYNLEKVMINFKEYPLYDKKYSCNINENSNLYYSDESRNNMLMYKLNNTKKHFYYIDYNQKYFKIKFKVIYNYISSTILDYNPFNEKYLKIQIDNLDDVLPVDSDGNCKYIKFNIDKSYIFNTNITQFDSNTNNVFGEVNYICYFNILYDDLYEYLKTLQDIQNFYSFKITINYDDTFINVNTNTEAYLDLLIDNYKDELTLGKILYHDYSVGFNYDGIGNMVGLCMIPNSQQFPANNYKPIFLKYFNNEKNYVVNYISDDILLEKATGALTNNKYSDNTSGDDYKDINGIVLTPNFDPSNGLVLYKDLNIDVINGRIGGQYYVKDGQNTINKIINTKAIYNNVLEQCFNDTYNINGNGLRKGDCYVPCMGELMLFYLLGFLPYINFIYNAPYEIDNQREIDSASLYYGPCPDTGELRLYCYSIYINPYLNGENYVLTTKNRIGTLKIDENGNYDFSTEGKVVHKSIALFKLPDYSVLYGNNYYLTFDPDDNFEVISYSTKNNVLINFKSYKSEAPSIDDFILYCKDYDLSLSSLSIKSIENNIYSLSFTINRYIECYNEIDIYYIDKDISFNTDKVTINEVTNSYRKLCRLSIKIE